jgi:NAD(P)-dependent dehydrogenase (short-subunit alcohol dehydrogenase family)
METAPFGIRVIVIEPGTIRTEFMRLASESLLRASGGTAYGEYAQRHAKMLARGEASKVPSPPETVAKTIVHCLRVERPKARYASGAAARPLLFLRRVLSDRMFDWLMWRLSQSFG